MLLWGRFPGTEAHGPVQKELATAAPRGVPELDSRGGTGGGAKRNVRKDGVHHDPLKTEQWAFPDTFVREQLHASPESLLVLEADGDSMAPTIASGERVIVDVE